MRDQPGLPGHKVMLAQQVHRESKVFKEFKVIPVPQGHKAILDPQARQVHRVRLQRLLDLLAQRVKLVRQVQLDLRVMPELRDQPDLLAHKDRKVHRSALRVRLLP